jgi:predicted transcriptional regulator of viral defense system
MNNKNGNKSVLGWIEQIQSKGRNSFSLKELKASPVRHSGIGIERALDRLLAKKKIVSVYKGYYIIISPQYSVKGFLPPNLFIDGLMKFLHRKYYVGLLSAAAIHGAAHQQPQEYYVVTELPALRPMSKRGFKINYVNKNNIAKDLVEQRKTEAGYINISSPALTALDLIQFEHRIGGLNRAAAILNELVEEMKPDQWNRALLRDVSNYSIQRLGFLLENVLGKKEHADHLYDTCKEMHKKFYRTALKSKAEKKGFLQNNRWKIVPNIRIEIDI